MTKKNTFLTTFDTNHEDDSELNLQSFKRVHALYDKLKTVVSQLNEKVSGVLEKQEKEFLAAYRAHMYNVQKELQQLRIRCEDAEMSLKKNEKISKLEEARDWFREEAQRLDRILQSMRKNVQHMQEKMTSIEEDRNWLEKQLKASKKQNKLLRAELEIRLNKQINFDDNDSINSGVGEVNNDDLTSNYFPSIGDGLGFPAPRSQTSIGLSRNHHDELVPGDDIDTYRHNNNNTAPGSSRRRKLPHTETSNGYKSHSSSTSESKKFIFTIKQKDKEIRLLRQSLATERKSNMKSRAAVVSMETYHNEIEELFVQCIEEIKSDIARRRMRNNVINNIKSVSPPTEEEIREIASNFGLRELTASDRKKLMEFFFSNDKILGMLYEAIFTGTDKNSGNFDLYNNNNNNNNISI